MNILVIGSGGREHAICSAFARSGKAERLFCAPGNAGIEAIAECVALQPEDIEGLISFAKNTSIGLTFVGGETALAKGIVDRFEAEGLRIFGVSQAAARLEASKSFAKEFMERHDIATAAFSVADSAAEAKEILRAGKFGTEDTPVVIKADGLAGGKGVIVAASHAEAIEGIESLAAVAGEDAAQRIVIEECLFGREVSLILFCSGEHFALMPPTRDHKRIGEGDTGPNTGGMGTISDDNLLTEEQLEYIKEAIIRPTLKGCIAEGFPFKGIMFLGLMMSESGSGTMPKVLEYNVRFGDPETQSILVRLETDLVEICDAVIGGRLNDISVEWSSGTSATVVLAAKGYPQSPQKGDVISGLEAASDVEGVTVFHAGTKRDDDGAFVTAGGRVLGITACAETLEASLEKAYKAVSHISWNGMQYRRDIGK